MTSAPHLDAVAQRLLDARAAARSTERPTAEDLRLSGLRLSTVG